MKRYAPLLLTFLFLPLLFSCFDLEEDLYDQLEKEDYYGTVANIRGLFL